MDSAVSKPKIEEATQDTDLVMADLEAWFQGWLERALPIYMDSYHSFMDMVKARKTGTHDVDLEAHCFYQSLKITREITSDDAHLEVAVTVMAPGLLALEYLKGIREVDKFLKEVEDRSIEKDGLSYIATNDLVKFIETITRFISEVASELANLIVNSVEPFNEFIKDIDNTIKIDLVDGSYHLIVDQEREEAQQKVKTLSEEKHKRTWTGLFNRTPQEPIVYVITSKEELVEYIKDRWPNEIVLTSHAEASLIASPYKNIKKLISVIDIIAKEFFDCFNHGLRMEDSVKALEACNAEFKPMLSDKAKGRHDVYKRMYLGRTANFDKHICLGSARDPQNCFRLHFEFCEEAQKIVVHHAGIHLPMSDD
jgi:hypothetical protein